MTLSNEERNELEELRRRLRKPPEATQEEMMEDEGMYQPEPPLRGGGNRRLNVPSGMGGGTIKMLVISVIVSLVAVFGLIVMVNAGKFVTHKEFDANWQGMVTSINEAKASMTQSTAQSKLALDTAVANIPTTVNTAIANTNTQFNQKIADLNNQVSNFNNSLRGYNTNISELLSKLDVVSGNLATANKNIADLSGNVTQYSNKIVALEDTITKLEARVVALETPSSSSSSGKTAIPGVTITVTVPEEGTLYTSDNSTYGQIKMTMVNSGTRDIVDVGLYLYVYFDESVITSKTKVSANYGGWSIRENTSDEVQLRGNISRLVAGQTRRIYIDIVVYTINNNVTYIDTSTSDVEVRDWDYSD